MYSRRLIDKKYRAAVVQCGWEPQYHSIAQIEEFKAYVDKRFIVEENSKNGQVHCVARLTERQQRDIQRFVQNEQILCTIDANYFLSRYCFICDEKGEIFQFTPRDSQKVFFSVVAHFEDLEVAIELFVLKARQLGVSTMTALMFLHRMLFIPNTQAVMASVQSDKSELIGRILNICYDRLPWWLPAQVTKDRIGKWGFDNGSILSIQSGMQPTGIAQGWTPTCLVPSSAVRVANGYTKKIRDVRNDVVLSHEGRLVSIKSAFQSSRNAEPTRVIKLWGNYDPLECTLDHRILTPSGWVEASELSVGDFVHHPIRKISHTLRSVQLSRYSRGKISAEKSIPFSLLLSPELAYLCGFYLAEGTIHESALNHPKKKSYISEIMFTIHTREVKQIVSAIRSVLGESQNVHVKQRSAHGSQLSVSCAWLAKWISENFGRTTNKHIPDWAFGAGVEFCEQLVKGYLDGDGHCEKGTNHVIAPSICRQIITQIRDLIASLGFGWASIYYKSPRVHKGVRRSSTWVLVMTGPCGFNYRKRFGIETRPMKNGQARHWKYSAGYINVKIESLSDGYSEEFYDIEVDEDSHSFTTAQMSVHNCIHISEVGDIPNPKKVIEEGLLKATHPSRKLFQVFEGTGNGSTGWQADKWRALKEDFPRGMARLYPLFINWPLATDLYPEADFMKKFPIPESWQPMPETKKHVQRCELYIRSSDVISKVVGKNWTMPRDQQWYWEFNYREAVKTHTQQIWATQMPADDYEALTGKNDLVFDNDVIEVRSRERESNYTAYAIVGNSIDDGFEPDVELIDYNAPRIPIEWESHRGMSYDWLLIPLKPFDEKDEHRSMDKLLVFEPPKQGRDYSVGIDTADGLGKEDEDRTVMNVTLSAKGNYPDVQVAEFTSNRVNPPQCAGFAAAVGAWYGPACRDPRGVKFCIEQRMRPGDDCYHQLKLMGFTFHHEMTNYDHKKFHETGNLKGGWFTNEWSRPFIFNRFVDAINNGWYKPNSKWLIAELRDLERKIVASGKSKMEHQSGKHDDRIWGAMLSYITRHHADVLSERSEKKYIIRKGNVPDLNTEYANIGAMSIGD